MGHLEHGQVDRDENGLISFREFVDYIFEEERMSMDDCRAAKATFASSAAPAATTAAKPERERDRETERQRDRETERQRDRETERLRD